MPSHETMVQAKRWLCRSSRAAKFVAAYQTSVHALATGIATAYAATIEIDIREGETIFRAARRDRALRRSREVIQ